MSEAITEQPAIARDAGVKDKPQSPAQTPNTRERIDSQPATKPNATGSGPTRGQRIAMGLGAGALGAAGLGAAIFGIRGDSGQSFSPDSTTPPGTELRLPGEQNFVGLGVDSLVLSSRSTIAFDADRISHLNNSLTTDNILIPSIDSRGQEINFQHVKNPATDGRMLSRLTFNGVSKDTPVKAFFSGNVSVREVSAGQLGNYKIVELKTTNSVGKEVDLAMTVPEDTSFIPQITSTEGGTFQVTAGQDMFTLKQGSVLPGPAKNNMEVTAFTGNPGDASPKQVNVDLLKDPSSGRVVIIGQ